MKKAQGLSLNTIIVAAIVLIVLVVLWAIFTGRMGTFTGGLKKQDEGNCPSLCITEGYNFGSKVIDTDKVCGDDYTSIRMGEKTCCCKTKADTPPG